MKALVLTSYGNQLRQNVQIMDIPEPEMGPGDVRIKIKAAALNPVDFKMVYGNAKMVWNPPKPYPLGFDCAGVISEVGSEVTDLNVGDEVYTRVPLKRIGTLAESITTPADVVAKKPANLTFSEAAGIPLVACTVMQSFAYFDIKPGSKILIHAGSGGVGSFAVQYAKHLGAEVFTTTSTRNVQWVKDLGARHVIDYQTQDYQEEVPELDFVFDTLGNQYIKEAIPLLKNGGAIVSIAGYRDDSTLKSFKVPWIIRKPMTLPTFFIKQKLKRKSASYKYVLMVPNKAQLEELSRLYEARALRPIIDREFSLNDAVEAMCYLETGRAQGKVVVVP